MSWENLSAEVAELFEETAPCVLDRRMVFRVFTPLRVASPCEYPGCEEPKPRVRGVHYCPGHGEAMRRHWRQRCVEVRVARLPPKCVRCERFAAVRGRDTCLHCTRDALRWRARGQA